MYQAFIGQPWHGTESVFMTKLLFI